MKTRDVASILVNVPYTVHMAGCVVSTAHYLMKYVVRCARI